MQPIETQLRLKTSRIRAFPQAESLRTVLVVSGSAWLVDSGGDIAVSKAGLALLESELSHGSSALSETAETLREG